MRELGVGAGLCEVAEEAVLGVLCALARLDSHHFGSVFAVVESPAHAPYLCEPAAPHTAKVLELQTEPLSKRVVLAAERPVANQSLASIYNEV